MSEPAFFDFAATSRVDERVADVVLHYMVEAARGHIAAVVEADPDEVIFTSGATESDNIAILGLADFADQSGRRHIVSTRVEHKAVLEPLEHLQSKGFEVTLLDPMPSGAISPADLKAALRPDTILVSVMHVNNETGKELSLLRNRRIDLISVSGHKIYAPKGIGALVTRKRRGIDRPPLRSLMYGGGQERGLRPGTVPVALAAGLGEAARLALLDNDERNSAAKAIEANIVAFVEDAGGQVNGDRSRAIPHIINASFKGLDSEAFIVATKSLVAVSNGAACSSHSYERSHVLEAMNLEPWRVGGAIRFSFSHESVFPDSNVLKRVIESVRF